jgi:shikimate kinase
LIGEYICAGMMGSGKSTVGKILAEVLGYSFFDRFVFPDEASCSSLQEFVCIDADGKFLICSATLQ